MTPPDAKALVAAILRKTQLGMEQVGEAVLRSRLRTVRDHATRLAVLLAERDAATPPSEDLKMALGTMLAAFGDHEWTPAERGPVQQTAIRVARNVLAKVKEASRG